MSNQQLQLQPIPQWCINQGKDKIAEAIARQEQAKKRIPAQYHDFLIMLEQNVKIADQGYDCSQVKKDGFFTYNGKTYVKISLPYFTVDGRVQMARDDHREKGMKLFIHPAQITDDGKYLSVTVESEMLGSATGTVAINVGGSGVDKTNPMENAETSAVGRALGFLGYGLVGTGIASAEEVQQAKNQEKKQTKPNADATMEPLPAKEEPDQATIAQPATQQESNENIFVGTFFVERKEEGMAQTTKKPFVKFVFTNEYGSNAVVLAKDEHAVETARQVPENVQIKARLSRQGNFFFLEEVLEIVENAGGVAS